MTRFVSLVLLGVAVFCALSCCNAIPSDLECMPTKYPPEFLAKEFPIASGFTVDGDTWWKLTCDIYDAKTDLVKIGTTVMLMNSTKDVGYFLNILYMRDPNNGSYSWYQNIATFVVQDPTQQPYSLCVRQDGVDDKYIPENYYNHKIEYGNQFYAVFYTQRKPIDGKIYDTTKNEGFFFGRDKKNALSFLFNANTNTGEGVMALKCGYENVGKCPIGLPNTKEKLDISRKRHPLMDGPWLGGEAPMYAIEWASKEMQKKWEAQK